MHLANIFVIIVQSFLYIFIPATVFCWLTYLLYSRMESRYLLELSAPGTGKVNYTACFVPLILQNLYVFVDFLDRQALQNSCRDNWHASQVTAAVLTGKLFRQHFLCSPVSSSGLHLSCWAAGCTGYIFFVDRQAVQATSFLLTGRMFPAEPVVLTDLPVGLQLFRWSFWLAAAADVVLTGQLFMPKLPCWLGQAVAVMLTWLDHICFVNKVRLQLSCWRYQTTVVMLTWAAYCSYWPSQTKAVMLTWSTCSCHFDLVKFVCQDGLIKLQLSYWPVQATALMLTSSDYSFHVKLAQLQLSCW